MRIEGSYTVPGTPGTVFSLLLDPAVLADCMPGCQQLVATSENQYEMKLKIALAALSGDFVGRISIEDPRPPASYRLLVDGAGRVGFLKGQGDLQFQETEGGTQVSYQGDVSAGGTIAAVGQRLLDTTARMMIRRFFERLVAHHAK